MIGFLASLHIALGSVYRGPNPPLCLPRCDWEWAAQEAYNPVGAVNVSWEGRVNGVRVVLQVKYITEYPAPRVWND